VVDEVVDKMTKHHFIFSDSWNRDLHSAAASKSAGWSQSSQALDHDRWPPPIAAGHSICSLYNWRLEACLLYWLLILMML